MPRKPFELAFSYVPKWKQNRQRDKANQLVIKLRDLPESRRVAEQQRIHDELKSSTNEEIAKIDLAQYVLSLTKANQEIVKTFVAKYLVEFEPFAVISTDEGAQAVFVSDLNGIDEYCAGLIPELYFRLINGPDADELKN